MARSLRTRRTRFFLVSLAVVAGLAVMAATGAAGATPNGTALRDGIRGFADQAKELAGQGVLGDAMAFTGLDPSGTDGLDLDTVFGDVLGGLPASFESIDPATAPADAAAELEALDRAAATPADLKVTVGCPAGGDCTGYSPVVGSVTGNVVTMNVPITVERTVSVPLDLPVPLPTGSPIQVEGSNLTIPLKLTGTLPFRLDTSKVGGADADKAFYVASPMPAFTATVDAATDSTGVSAAAKLGFTDLTATVKDLNAAMTLTATLRDPDLDGQLTFDEFDGMALTDMFALARSGTATGSLTLDTSLTTTDPDFTKAFTGPDTISLTDGFTFPQINPTDLMPFRNVTPEQVISGFGQSAAALAGSQKVGDVDLPFLDGALSEVISVAQPVFDFVNQQAVVCGTAEQTPPTGVVPEIVPSGTKIYCQAFVVHDPLDYQVANVAWQVGDGIDATYDSSPSQADTDASVALAPSKHAVFTMTQDGPFDAFATYDLVDPEATGTELRTDLKTERPAQTAQQLLVKLNELGGFMDQADLETAVGSGAKVLDYDVATKALSFRLRKELPDVEEEIGYNVGDQLEKSSGVIALQGGAAVNATVTAGGGAIDVTIGVLLGELSDIGQGQPCADPNVSANSNTTNCPANPLDRFFVKVDPSDPEFAVDDATVEIDPGSKLAGRLGFVGIEAEPTTFALAKKTSGSPVLSVNLTTPGGGLNVGAANIPDAIRLRQLLFSLGDFVSAPAINLKFDAVLDVKALVGNTDPQTELGSGTITVGWPDITSGLPEITANQTFTDTLQGFNTEPNLFGTHTAGASPATAPDPLDPGTAAEVDPATLTDSAASFTAGEVVGKRLDNLTDGSFCTVTAATATTLTCATGLGGGTVNQWNSEDEYRVQVGDPLDMLWKLLDNLDAVVAGIDGLSGGGAGAGAIYEKNLPFVGVSPKELVRQINDLKRASSELRGGPQPTIACGLNDGNPPTGDPSQLNLAGGATKDIYCRLDSAKPATQVQWSFLQGGTITSNATDTETVVTPTSAPEDSKTVTAAVAGASSQGGQLRSNEFPGGYAIRATFTDDDGQHVVDFPEQSVPPTLQAFEEMLESKLNLPATAFALSPMGSGSTRRMKLDLQYGICGYEGATAPAICSADARQTPSFAAPLNVDLGPSGGLVGVGADADVDVTYAADARLAMSFAVSPSLDPKVEPDTGIAVKGRAAANNIDLTANLGPFAIQAGTGGKPTDDGAGVLKVGADFTLDNPSTTPETISSFISGLTADFGAPAGTGEDCGAIDLDDPHTAEAGNDTAVSGIACGRLSLGFRAGSTIDYIDDVAFAISGIEDDGDITPALHIPDGFADKLAARVISWDTLLNALPELLARVEEGLRASSGTGPDGGKVPIIGDALDAGADVAGVINDEVIPLAQTIGNSIDSALVDCSKVDCVNEPPGCDPDADPPTDPPCQENVTPNANPENVETFVQDFLWDELGAPGAGLVRKNAASATPAVKEDIVVTTLCGGADCTTSNSLFDIDDVRITFNLGQAAGTDVDEAPAFDIGFDGVPLRVAGALEAKAGWNLLVDLGVSTSDGPYLVVADDNTPGYTGGDDRPAELFVDAEVKLGAEPENDAICNSEVNDPATGDATATAISAFSASADRCLAGKLGFVSVNIRDEATEAKRTRAGIETSLDLRKESAPSATTLTKLKLTELVSGELQPVAALDVDARANLRFRTGIGELQDAGFPTVVGTFSLGWGFAKSFGGAVDDSGTGLRPLEIGFDNLHLDISKFFEKYLKPTLTEVRNIVGPFKPVIDTLNAPIPVVSDLAELVGQPPLTLLGLMELISDNNLTVIKSMAAFVKFAVDVASDPDFANGLIALGDTASAGGAFPLLAASASDRKKLGSSPGPSNADSLIDKASGAYKAGKDLLAKEAKAGTTTGAGNTAAANLAANKGMSLTRDNLPGTFGVPGLTFPFMSDASQIFGFIMGNDVTLVRYDIGTLRATAGFSYNFGPFMIGPVPVTAGIGGSATLEGRFALGYDTSGLRKVLSGGSGVYLFDGIFIDDLDTNQVDVPEIKLIGEVYARAGVTVFIATAGIEGGIRMTVALNLDDSPDPDGKLRIEEIFNKLSNPICLFEVSGKLEAFLKAFLEINYFVGSERWDFTILEVTLLDFSKSCEPPKPQLASQSGDTLTLNMGSEALRNARKISTGETDEKFVVRPAGGGRYSVSAFGVYQVYGPNAPFPGAAITKVVANGADGNDQILMEPGNDETNGDANEIPFSAVADLDGGDHNDVLTGGTAADPLDGGSGDDKIDGREGGDTITGGDNNDQISGGQGVDTISGGAGADRISGGPAGDTIDAGSENDIVQGGPAADPATPGVAAALLDGGDTIVGGTGNDNLEGGFGGDVMHGDAAIACTDTGTPGGDDIMDGGPAADTMNGGAGNDRLVGGPGGDTLCGNNDHDELDGDDSSLEAAGGGDDNLNGGAGNDVTRGRSGRDVIHGDADSDVLFGGAGADNLLGDGGDDDLMGAVGNDVLDGGAGTNILVGDSATIAGADSPPTNRRAMPADQPARVSLVSNIGTAGDNIVAPSCAYSRAAAGTAIDLAFADCLLGGSGDDVMFGEGGKDRMQGSGAADYMRGGDHDDEMDGDAGTDDMYGDLHADTMRGGTANDTMRGNEGADYMEGNGGTDTMRGDADDDRMIGGSNSSAADANDVMDGDGDEDVMAGDNATITTGLAVTLFDIGAADGTTFGGDTMNGGPHDDLMFGQSGVDTMNGNVGRDRVIGNGAGDTVNGNADGDLLIGGSSPHATLQSNGAGDITFGNALDGDDTINGNEADDLIFGDNVDADFDALQPAKPVFAGSHPAGSYGNDILAGNDGQDVIWGELGGDTMTGGADEDYLVGDLALVNGDAGGGPLATWPGDAPDYTVSLVQPLSGGSDTMDGADANDHLFGGAAADTISGGVGDDYLEGNSAQDKLYGLSATFDDGVAQASDATEAAAAAFGSDQDDIIGGSSTMAWSGASSTTGSDTGETEMYGNADHDVMAGDNADITRIVSSTDATQWADDLVLTGARRRDVSLRDREKSGSTTPKLGEVSGADDMFGNGGFDRMYGQGKNDRMKGNDSADYLEGNQNSDWLEGNDGEDDLIGGSSFSPTGQPQAGDPDTTDFLHGGGESDVISGDNAVISRTTSGAGSPVYFTTQGRFLGFTTPRWIRLLDLAAPAVSTRFGNDFVSGGEGEDIAFGQDGNDAISGGPDDDYLEGNGGIDRVFGDRLPWDSSVTARFPTVPAGIGAADGSGFRSTTAQLDGPAAGNGQDDILGGSALAGHRDGQGGTTPLPDPSQPFTSAAFEARFGDYLFGDGDDDFFLGDNGTLTRFSAGYLPVEGTYMTSVGNDGLDHRLVREAVRYDVVAPPTSAFGDDFVEGNGGDDAVWAQNGADEVWGNAGDDDLLGEVGNDRVYGGAGEDALVGDRGSVTNTWITDAMRAGGNFQAWSIDTNGPPFLRYQAFTTNRYDRRVDLFLDAVGSVGGLRPSVTARTLQAGTSAGNDTLRGGEGHDSIHAGFGDDYANGDTGGDYVFGGRGADVMWGGRGSPVDAEQDLRQPSSVPEGQFDDRWVDYLFGGRGGPSTTANGIVTGGADVLDFRPRVNQPVGKKGQSVTDPVAWQQNVSPYVSRHGEVQESLRQHHQGVDWVWGGWNRDVMQANVAGQGPNDRDRLMDWSGAYNLYTHCEPDYGGYNDIRSISPLMLDVQERLAFASGAGSTLENVRQGGTSGFEENALVYNSDVKSNSGSSYPATPGNFTAVACGPDTP